MTTARGPVLTDPRPVGVTVMEVTRNWEGSQITRTPRDIPLALPLDDPVEVGEFRRYTITLPYLPPSKNEWNSMQDSWRSGIKARWIKAIVRECEAQDMPKGATKIGLAARLTFPTRTPKRDPQNYAATLWDFVPDALEDKQHGRVRGEPLWGYGMIPDDSAGRIEWGANHGIRFAYDERKGVPAKMRRRTALFIGVRVP